jgi:hypothetical protein
LSICTVYDTYLDGFPHWAVILSDDTIVFGDDGRPGESPPSAWLRLREHCREHAVHPIALYLRSHGHAVEVETGYAKGYFFARQACSVWGGDTTQAIITGTLGEDGRIHTHRWSVPGLDLLDEGVRDMKPDDICMISS